MDTPAPAVPNLSGPIFTADWFHFRIKDWEKFLVPPMKDKPTRWLELGSYEGRSALWTAENILTHPDSRLICVDAWYSQDVSDRFDANILGSPCASKITKIKAQCFDALRQVSGPFDAVYVDADHQAKSALRDGATAFQLLRKGGFLIFDDYPWQQPDPSKLPPKPGIDAFLELWAGDYTLIHKEWQVIVQKN